MFTKFKNIENIKIYYDLNEKFNNKLYYLNNEDVNIISELCINELCISEYCYEYKEIIKDDLPYYENNKLFIKY